MIVDFLWNNFSCLDKNRHSKRWMSSGTNDINLSIDEHILTNDRTEIVLKWSKFSVSQDNSFQNQYFIVFFSIVCNQTLVNIPSVVYISLTHSYNNIDLYNWTCLYNLSNLPFSIKTCTLLKRLDININIILL